MSGNAKNSSRDFGDSFQLINWILDSVETCHMTPQVSGFSQVFYIEVAYGHHIMAKKKVQV